MQLSANCMTQRHEKKSQGSGSGPGMSKGIFSCCLRRVRTGQNCCSNPTDVSDWGSVSKTFTATAVLRLIDQGKLGLDDTVGMVHPDLAKQYSRAHRDHDPAALGNDSGIPDYLNIPKVRSFATLTNTDPRILQPMN